MRRARQVEELCRKVLSRLTAVLVVCKPTGRTNIDKRVRAFLLSPHFNVNIAGFRHDGKDEKTPDKRLDYPFLVRTVLGRHDPKTLRRGQLGQVVKLSQQSLQHLEPQSIKICCQL